MSLINYKIESKILEELERFVLNADTEIIYLGQGANDTTLIAGMSETLAKAKLSKLLKLVREIL